jgi:mRNA interferase MazF
MTDYDFGDIILVSFPFTDQTATKRRPAVIISSAAYNRQRPDLIIMAITSRLRTNNFSAILPFPIGNLPGS